MQEQKETENRYHNVSIEYPGKGDVEAFVKNTPVSQEDVKEGEKHAYTLLRCENKEALIYWGEGYIEVLIKNNNEKKERGAMTTLMREVKMIIEKEVQTKGKSRIFLFTSENANVIAWAQTQGRELFSWDKEENMTEEDNPHMLFMKEFHSSV